MILLLVSSTLNDDEPPIGFFLTCVYIYFQTDSQTSHSHLSMGSLKPSLASINLSKRQHPMNSIHYTYTTVQRCIFIDNIRKIYNIVNIILVKNCRILVKKTKKIHESYITKYDITKNDVN